MKIEELSYKFIEVNGIKLNVAAGGKGMPSGSAIDAGHLLPEEKPKDVVEAISNLLASTASY